MTMPTRTTKLDDWAAMEQSQQRYQQLPRDEQMHEKLLQLRMFIRQLQDTPQGRLDLEQRARVLGPCERGDDEDAGTFYGRLRRWIDKDL